MPCAPASASVWQPEQPVPAAWKIVFPSFEVTLPPPEQAAACELPAQRATNAETSSRSFPLTRFAGMTVVPVGVTSEPSAHFGVSGWNCGAGQEMPCRGTRIWSATTCSIVLDLKPCSRTAEKALSRFGPILPLAPAAASVWQLAQENPELAGCVNTCLP